MAAEIEQAIRSVLEALLSTQGLESVLVNPGLDRHCDRVTLDYIKFRLVKPCIDPKLLSGSTTFLRRALWAVGEHCHPHLRHDFNDDQRILGTEN